MTKYRDHDVVVPALKISTMLDTGSFIIRVSHGEKYGRLAHALCNFSFTHQVLFIGREFFKDLWIALDALLWGAGTAAK